MNISKTYICVRSALVSEGLKHYIKSVSPATAIEIIKTTAEILNLKKTDVPVFFIDMQLLPVEPGLVLDKIKQFNPSSLLINDRYLAYFDYQILLEDPQEKIENYIRLIYQPETYEYSQFENIQIISTREIEILKYVALGYTNKEISDKLNLSVHTVITHRKNITFKLGIKTIAGLTVYAILQGIITAEEVQS
jgi:DNA-binding CsgD family transcriptional regulator